MKVKTLRMQNFRGFEDVTLDFHDRVTVLIGENGAGKSSVLDCLGILLSRIIARMGGLKKSTIDYSENDIKIGKKYTNNSLDVNYIGNNYTWSKVRKKSGTKKTVSSNLKEARELGIVIQDNLESNLGASLPLILYFNINRNVNKPYISDRKRNLHEIEQITAWNQAISRTAIDFQLFFKWFDYRESIEHEEWFEKMKEMLGSDTHKTINELIKEVGNQDGGAGRAFNLYRYRENILLDSIRNAVELLMPNYTNLRVKRKKSMMVVTKDGQEFFLNQLSDGEKDLLALVGDLTRRIAIANPGLADPLQGEGIVMIDEIELHLHPTWQRMIIPKLTAIFPNLQFIVTTHSPQVLSDVKKEWTIYTLRQEKDSIKAYKEDNIYGADSNWLLKNMMNIGERPQEVQSEIDRLFSLVDNGDLDAAKQKVVELADSIGDYDPILTKARVLIHRKELLSQ